MTIPKWALNFMGRIEKRATTQIDPLLRDTIVLTLALAHREGFEAGKEAAAQIIERHPEEHPMQPFEGDIQECCRVMAASVRDTACPDPVEKEARDGSAKGTPA